jgi:hypothetical protein
MGRVLETWELGHGTRNLGDYLRGGGSLAVALARPGSVVDELYGQANMENNNVL